MRACRFRKLANGKYRCLIGLFFIASAVTAHEEIKPPATFGIGVGVGTVNSNGLLLRQYYDRRYLQLALLVNGELGDDVIDQNFALHSDIELGSHWQQGYIKSMGLSYAVNRNLALGNHLRGYFASVAHAPGNRENWLFFGPGSRIDLFNPYGYGFVLSIGGSLLLTKHSIAGGMPTHEFGLYPSLVFLYNRK